MAFVANNLTLMDAAGLGTVNTYCVYKYTSNDLLSTIYASGYFNSAYKKFHLGDTIIVSADVDGTPLSNILAVTSATAATTVTTTALSTATLTFNALYSISVDLAALNGTETQYIPVPSSGSVTAVYGCADSNGGGATSTATLTKNGSGAVAAVAYTSGYTAGAILAPSVTAQTFVAGTDYIKVVQTSTSVTATGKAHIRILYG